MTVIQSESSSIVHDITILYELSLSIGKSLILEENCKFFFDKLLERKNLAFISLWLASESNPEMYEEIFAVPPFRSNQTTITKKHFIHKKLQQSDIVYYAQHDQEFKHLIQEKNITKGAYAIFKLEDIGFLKIYSINKKSGFHQLELNQLKAIIEKFGFSVKACIAHQELEEVRSNLRQSDLEIKALLNSTTDKIFAIDRDFRLTHYNKSAEYSIGNLFGHEQLTIGSIMLPMKESTKKQWIEHYNDVIVRGKKLRLEKSYRISENGKTQICYDLVNLNPIINAENECIGMTLFGKEITDLKKTQNALITSELKFRNIYEKSPMGIVYEEGKDIHMANHHFCNMIGYPKEEVTKELIEKISYPDDLIKQSEEYIRLSSGVSKYIQTSKRYVHKNGSTVWTNVSVAGIYSQDNKLLSHMALIEDITGKRLAELEIQRVNSELKEFAYIVSHDLKAPLRGINSLSHWIVQDYGHLFDKEGKELLNLIKNRVNRMHNFIEGILEYSRIGRIKTDVEEVNMNALVQEVFEVFQVENEVKLKIKNKLPTIKCEKLRIGQVFQNLISNAIKYNDKKKTIIEISAKEEGRFYVFNVKDNGPGIQEKYQERIFKIFQTLQARDRFESTGIGLTIVKRIIENQGGTIQVHSKHGQGTTFEFTIKKV